MNEVFIIYETTHYGMNVASKIDSIYANYDDALKALNEKNSKCNIIAEFTLTKEPVIGMSKKEIDDSWERNPDRSGGQFTQEEKNRPNWS